MARQAQGSSFNPEIDVRDPKDFLNFSKGADVDTRGDSAMGKLFSNIGDMVGAVAKTSDTIFNEVITDELHAGVDAVRKEVGVEAATDVFGERPEAPQTPGEITRSMRTLEDMNQAVKQGTMQESHYWARMNAVARQLRSKYAGHRDLIDQKISSMTGSNPANALVRSLRSEAEEAARKAGNEASKDQAFVDGAIKGGHASENLVAAYQNGLVDINYVRRAVAQSEYFVKNLEIEQKIFAARKASGEQVREEATRSLGTNLQTIISQGLDDTTSLLGLTSQKLAKITEELNSGTRVYSPEEKVQMSGYMGTIISEAQKKIGAVLKSYTGLVDTTEMNKQVEAVMAPLFARKEALEKGDLALFNRDKVMFDAVKTNRKLEVLSNESLARASAIKDVLGENVLLTSLPKDAPGMNAFYREVVTYATHGLLNPRSNDSLAKTLEEVRGMAPKGETVLERNVVSNSVRLMTDPKTPTAGVERLIDGFFNDDNKRFLRSVPGQERAGIFNQMTSPSVETRVLEMAKQKPEIKTKYESWVKTSVSENSVATLNALAKYKADRGEFVDIQFDGTSFVAVPTGKTSTQPLAADSEASAARYLVRDLNAYHRPLAGIYEREGKGRDLAAFHLVGSVGLGNMVPMANVTTKGLMKLGGPKDGDNADAAFPKFTQEGKEVDKGITVTNDALDEELQKKMIEEERGAGIPNSPPDFTRLSQELDGAFKALAGENLSPKQEQEFWNEFLKDRRKRWPSKKKSTDVPSS